MTRKRTTVQALDPNAYPVFALDGFLLYEPPVPEFTKFTVSEPVKAKPPRADDVKPDAVVIVTPS